ncbi:MAG: DUF5916 domain-containing protein [Pseudomonadota bacterium]
MSRGRQSVLLLLATGLLAWPGVSARADYSVPAVEGNIIVDGALNEAFWQSATVVTLDYETIPDENTPADVRTEVLIAENGDKLLVAFRAFDPEPDSIVAYLSDRDAAYSDDFVGIVLDTFNDERRAFEFFANPLGIQMDLTFDDVNGNEDDSWDAIWDSAGQITDDGFVVEMAIPFRMLQFPAGNGEKTFGFDLLRFRPRSDRVRLSNNPQDRERPCYLCQLDKLTGFSRVTPGRNLVIAPSAVATRDDALPEVGDSLESGDVEFEPSLDVRWGVTPDINLTATLNPDFSQVEADVAQLQINQRFALFFPEQRPFFLEGADFFASPIDAVFTRNVADPDYGAKVTGKIDGHTFGAFVADDRLTNLLLPGPLGSDVAGLETESETAVARYAYDVGQNSRVGALVTARRGDNYENLVAGIDGRFQFADYHEVSFQYLGSSTEYPDEVVSDFELNDAAPGGTAWRARWSRDTRNWFHFIQHQDYSRGFRADMGFVPQVDFTKTVAGVFRNFWAPEGQWWNRVSMGGDWDITHDQSGRLLERELEAEVSLQAALRSYIEIGVTRRQQLFDDQLFKETQPRLFAEMNPDGATYLGLFARTGDQVDFANSRLGDNLLISPRINRRFGKGGLMRLRHTWQELEFEGERVFRVNLTDLRVQYQFNPTMFVRLIVLHRDIDRNPAAYLEPVEASTRSVSSQLLFSYKANPQTVFFLGYGDSRLEDDEFTDLTQTDRSFFLKVGYAWLP